MFRPYSIFLGLRYTASRSSSFFVSFIAWVSMAGLALGVAALISVLSVMNGFDRELQTRILGLVPNVTVQSVQGAFSDWEQTANDIAALPGVTGVAPNIQLQGMMAYGGRVAGALVTGIEPERERHVSVLPEFVSDGALRALEAEPFQIILGRGLAAQLGIGLGDPVTLVMPEATVSPVGVMPRFKRFTVVGIFQSQSEMDGLHAYVRLSDAAKLTRTAGRPTALRVSIEDLFEADQMTFDIQYALGRGYRVSNWQRTQGGLFQAIQMEKTMMAFLLLLIVAVAAFNIVSGLVMVVKDKKPDIAILRTLGASPRGIMVLFWVQGTVIGVVGTLAGVVLGVTIALNISDFVGWLEGALDRNLLGAYFINYMPSQLKWMDVLWVSGASFGVSFLATLYPAWRAALTQPAEALRHE